LTSSEAPPDVHEGFIAVIVVIVVADVVVVVVVVVIFVFWLSHRLEPFPEMARAHSLH
jgi:hypothetical protein